MSSVFIDNEGLYRKTVQSAVLVHRPHYSARLMRFGSRGPSKFFSQLRHPNAFTEIEWADGERGLGIAMSTLVSEKQGIVTGYCCLSATRFTNSDISGCCFTSISKARPPVQS